MHMQWLYNQITMNKSGFKVEIPTALMEIRKYFDGMIPAWVKPAHWVLDTQIVSLPVYSFILNLQYSYRYKMG